MTRRLTSWALALAFVTGCGASGLARPCFSNSACPGTAQCVLGECTTSTRSFPVDLDLEPLPASGYLPQPVTGIPPSTTGDLDVVIPKPVTIHVRASDPVTVTFNAEGDLVHPLSYATEVQAKQPGVTLAGSVDLVPGVLDGKTGKLSPLKWSAVVVPTSAGCCDGTGPCTAPIVVPDLLLGANTDWVPPLPTSVVEITGKVVGSQASWTPIENLQVQVFDPTTGVFSLPARTDATGAFCLAVAPPPAGTTWHLTLRLGPSDTRPTVDVTGIDVTAGGGNIDLGAVAIGDHGAPLPPISGVVKDANGKPIQAARVTFDGKVDPKGTFSVSVTTAIDGTFSVTLLRGTYEVRAEPPADSPDGPAVTTGFDPTSLAVGDRLTLTTAARPVVTGTVLGPTTSGGPTSPLANVQVIADPDPNAQGTPAPQSFTAVTNGRGVYHLAVDPGAYQVRFVPPPGSGLPWAVGRALTITQDRKVDPVTLEQPAILPGKALGKAGGSTVALPGTKVEVYGHTPSGRAVLLWRGRAGTGGLFEVRLPQSIAGRLTGG